VEAFERARWPCPQCWVPQDWPAEIILLPSQRASKGADGRHDATGNVESSNNRNSTEEVGVTGGGSATGNQVPSPHRPCRKAVVRAAHDVRGKPRDNILHQPTSTTFSATSPCYVLGWPRSAPTALVPAALDDTGRKLDASAPVCTDGEYVLSFFTNITVLLLGRAWMLYQKRRRWCET
jgi:hypothetical protein